MGSALLTPGCATHEARIPMRVVRYAADCTRPAKTLLMLLPGAYDTPADFVKHGFVDELAQRGIGADIWIADAHTGYYTDRRPGYRMYDRQRTDLIDAARARGYERLWFVGISLGGYGSLLYSMDTDAPVEGMLLLAPFMGSRDVPRSVAEAGGLAKWRVESVARRDHDTVLWQWLQGYTDPSIAPTRPRIHIGFGKSDRFVASNRLLAQVLPSDRVYEVEGGHDWPPWREIWQRFLDGGIFVKGASRSFVECAA